MTFNPSKEVNVGDAIKLSANLSGAGQDFEEIFWIEIIEPDKPKTKGKKEADEKIGLPKYVLVYKDERSDHGINWEGLEEKGVEMGFQTIMHPSVEGETLDTIYINMDSTVLKNYKSKLTSSEQMEIADKRYISSVYFHTLFLYTITQNRKYKISRESEEGYQDEAIEITQYLKDLFESYYSAFLLNFEMSDLIASLED